MPKDSEEKSETRAEAQREFSELMARVRALAEAETRREFAARQKTQQEMRAIIDELDKLADKYGPLVNADAQDLIADYHKTLNDMGGAVIRNLGA